MKILSIETSCDETGVSLISGNGSDITILGNSLASQIDIHAQYGGVFPALAKRAHAEKIVPLLINTLAEANMLSKNNHLSDEDRNTIITFTDKDPILQVNLLSFFESCEKPPIDYIAVTSGPGLEPALWVGITVAKVLSALWNIPLLPINHMEGHVLVTLLSKKNEKEFALTPITFPSLSLLVSGGHTELVYNESFGAYRKIGATRDDAVGEAFDKVARMLGLPYPGGPEVSKLARIFREKNIPNPFTLPRPMIYSKDYDFSFSGIKTAVLYTIRDHGELDDTDKQALSAAFEDACIEVLVTKTKRAIEEFSAHTLIIGGGVAGNTYLREQIQKSISHVSILFPGQGLSTDNAIMIAIAAYVRLQEKTSESIAIEDLRANGNLSITEGGFQKH